MSINNPPLVSIIAICYNQQQYCISTLNSIINQEYTNIELIIIDDFSSDNSVEVIEEWIALNSIKCQFIKHTTNLGVTKVLNNGISKSRGKYIKPFACDDIMEHDYVNKCVVKLEKTSDKVGVCITDMTIIDDVGEELEQSFLDKKLIKKYEESDSFFNILSKTYFLPGPTIFFKSIVFQKVGLYDETFVVEDIDFHLRLSRFFNLVYIDEKLIKYRRHGNNLSNSLNDSRLIVGSIFAYLKHVNDFSFRTEEYENLKNVVVVILKRVARKNFALRKRIYREIFKTNFLFGLKVLFFDFKINMFKFK